MVDFLLGFTEDADAERGNRSLVTEEGNTLLVTPVPTSAIGGGVLTFANIAALEAFNVTTAPTPIGSLAVVLSNNSLWDFTHSAVTVDNITVASSTGDAAGRWQRFASLAIPFYSQQTAWHVNPVSGNDEHDGLTTGTAIKTFAEMFRRFGYTLSPEVTGDVVITVDVPQTDATDPFLFTPTFNSGTWVLTSPLPAPAFTGTILAITPKNRALNDSLTATFNTTTGAIAVRMMLVNATRGNSRAFVEATGDGFFFITQPLAPETPPAAPVSTEVDTWAATDAITGYVLNAICVGVMGGATVLLDASFNLSLVFYQADMLDTSGFGINQTQVGGQAGTGLVECASQRSLFFGAGSNNLICQNSNLFMDGAVCASIVASGANPAPLTVQFAGGALKSSGIHLTNAKVFQDCYIDGSAPRLSDSTLGNVFSGATVVSTITLGGSVGVIGVQYGSDTLNSVGTVSYGAEPNAVTAFPTSGGLNIDGQTLAYGYLTTAGNVATYQHTLSPANLDAAAAVPPGTGFGGLAFIPGVGAFTNGSTP